MRFYPPAWVIPRTAVEDDVIDGHRIPKGATVIIPIHSIHHDERFWPDPEVFDPTRFIGDEREAAGTARPTCPFGGGKRICIGTSFALMEATLITAMMSQRLRLRPRARPSRRARGDAHPAPAQRREDDRPAHGSPPTRRWLHEPGRRRTARAWSSPARAAASARAAALRFAKAGSEVIAVDIDGATRRA